MIHPYSNNLILLVLIAFYFLDETLWIVIINFDYYFLSYFHLRCFLLQLIQVIISTTAWNSIYSIQ